LAHSPLALDISDSFYDAFDPTRGIKEKYVDAGKLRRSQKEARPHYSFLMSREATDLKGSPEAAPLVIEKTMRKQFKRELGH
jgi:hypothetical protein